jgi:hypothetical protein
MGSKHPIHRNDENLFIITNAQVAQHLRAEVDRVFGQLAQEFA